MRSLRTALSLMLYEEEAYALLVCIEIATENRPELESHLISARHRLRSHIERNGVRNNSETPAMEFDE